MATLTSKLIVQLIDRASKPATRISATINRLTAMQARNSMALAKAQSQMFGAGAAAFALYKSLAGPIRTGAEFQTMLEDIRQKAGLAAPELRTLSNRLRDIAIASNQLPSDTIKTFDALLGLGLGGKTDAENIDAALKMMPAINKVSAAYRAASTDVMTAGQAVFANLKVLPSDVIKAFDSMARAGKDGAFELKDMAKYFPALTSQASALGIKGVKGVADLAAALQVVRQGAGDSSEAANNLKNVLQKVMSPVTQTNFKKFGVNFRREMKRAEKAGLSPIEAVAMLTDRVLKKNKNATLGDLFADREAQLGLLALLADMPRYRALRAAALNASGEVEKDFAERIKTADAAMVRFRGSVENLKIELSAGLLPAFTAIIDRGLLPALRAAKDFAKANPKLTSSIVGVAAGLIGLQVAATAARFAFLWLKGGVIGAAIKGLMALGRVTLVASRAFVALRAAVMGATMLGAVGGGGLLSGIVAGVGGAITAILGLAGGLAAGIAAITAPVWGIIGAIALAVGGLALAIYKYWVPISNFVSGFASVVAEALSGVVSGITAFGGQIASAVGTWAAQKLIDFGAWLGIDEDTMLKALNTVNGMFNKMSQYIIDTIKAIPAAVGGWISELFTMNSYSDEATAGFRTAGENAGRAFVEAIKNAFGALADWFRSLPGRILGWIGKINLSGIVSMPSVPAAPAIAGARGAGGPVRRGSTYLVGERGPELWRAPASGRIDNAMATVAALKAQATGRAQSGLDTIAALKAQAGVSDGGGSGKARGGAVTNVGGVTIHVQGAPGQSPTQIAEAVERHLSSKLNALSRGAFSDGVY